MSCADCTCPNCGLILSSKQRLGSHLESGVCRKPELKCGKCNKEFTRRYRYNDHVARCRHGDPPEGIVSDAESSGCQTPPPLPLDFVSTSTQSVLDHITSSPEAQDRLRSAFERGCLHEELLRLTHYAGPAENRNVVSIDNKGAFMKVLQDNKALVMNANMGVQMIINRNIALATERVVTDTLGIQEPALSPATTPRQKTYESLQIRAVIANAGDYVMPTRAFVQEVVEKPTRIAWSTRTRNCVAAQQGWQCNVCEDLLTDCYDIDHRVPLFKGGEDAFSNLQALCVPCHRNKTAAERSKQPILLP